jgi:hypothetical protein
MRKAIFDARGEDFPVADAFKFSDLNHLQLQNLEIKILAIIITSPLQAPINDEIF